MWGVNNLEDFPRGSWLSSLSLWFHGEEAEVGVCQPSVSCRLAGDVVVPRYPGCPLLCTRTGSGPSCSNQNISSVAASGLCRFSWRTVCEFSLTADRHVLPFQTHRTSTFHSLQP